MLQLDQPGIEVVVTVVVGVEIFTVHHIHSLDIPVEELTGLRILIDEISGEGILGDPYAVAGNGLLEFTVVLPNLIEPLQLAPQSLDVDRCRFRAGSLQGLQLLLEQAVFPFQGTHLAGQHGHLRVPGGKGIAETLGHTAEDAGPLVHDHGVRRLQHVTLCQLVAQVPRSQAAPFGPLLGDDGIEFDPHLRFQAGEVAELRLIPCDLRLTLGYGLVQAGELSIQVGQGRCKLGFLGEQRIDLLLQTLQLIGDHLGDEIDP